LSPPEKDIAPLAIVVNSMTPRDLGLATIQNIKSLTFFRLVVLASLFLLSHCASSSYIVVDSTNQNSRVDYLVIHGTSENFAESLRLLTTDTPNPVSVHYLVPETNDHTYPIDKLRVYSLVPEHRRAWHAGRSYWAEESSLNNRSIGIEVVNEFKCGGSVAKPLSESPVRDVSCRFLPYSDAQVYLLITLIKDILARYPELDPIDIVGHSDIAIMRKSDPGPLFPWKRLYKEGIGPWPDDDTVANYMHLFAISRPAIRSVQLALATLGYEIELTGLVDPQTQFTVRAFQLHFRPSNYSGALDIDTLARLWALLEKYRSDELAEMAL
jgi:N-acetyl-anhydromuramyl-L-alanine amidase AmpD